jgi:hypothetical protein
MVVLVMAAGVAGAKSNSQADAKAVAEGFIESFLPSEPGRLAICNAETHSGFFAKKASYLASCENSPPASFIAFSITNAKNGSLNTNSPYFKSRP